MKKAVITMGLLAMVFVVMAGGIVHNTNQSASFIRMPARDAVLGIDAAYYNPAGMTSLSDGFHLSLSNQYITQTRKVNSTFPGMNLSEFEGGVTAPIFPSAYAVYKKNRLAFSLGFNPIGGGGSALYEDGLPSLEMQPSTIPAALSARGVPTTSYSLETEFEGRSVYYGFQAGVAYQIHDELSLSIGARYVLINNTYNGYLRNIQINPNFPAIGYTGTMRPATTFFSDFSGYLSNVSATLQTTGNSLNPIIVGGSGDVLLANGTMVGLTPEQVALLQGTITQLGGNPSGMTIAQAQQFYLGASANFAANSATMMQTSVATRDMELDVAQTGSAIVPIIGVNMQLAENFNIAVKYEFKAAIEVKNDTRIDDVGLYPDGAEVPSDMPAMLSVGMQWAPGKIVKLHAGMHQYFDRTMRYGKKIGDEYVTNMAFMTNDYREYAFGAEFNITERLLLSAGYLRTETGVNDEYQTDLTHSLSTNSFGGGLLFKITDGIGVNLGAMRTWYNEADREFVGWTETYDREAMVLALGLDFSF